MHSKLYSIAIILTLSISSAFSQTNPFSKDIPKSPDGIHRCYTEQYQHFLYENDPEFRNQTDNSHLRSSNPILSQRLFSDSIIRIPVVVHVVYNSSSSNISKAQIESQIRILNEDFRRIPGTNGFGPGADTRFEFFLAQKDESGNCTDGIVRIQNSFSNHNIGDGLKSAVPNWNPAKYLNIWVVNGMGGTLGYATLPNSPVTSGNQNDGVVVADQYFGDLGTSGSGAYGFGRTTTHEVGHWLGLYHTFDGCTNASNCSVAGDLVCDTPPANSPTFSCSPTTQCSGQVQIENYMEYTNDLCMDRFTQGQSDRMLNVVTSFRNALTDSMNAINAGYNGCAVTAAISGSDTVCIGNQVNLLFNLTGIGPFDIVYTDGTNNFNISGVSSPHNEVIIALQGTSIYSIVSVTDQDSTKTAPDPALSGTAEITALIAGATDATLSGAGSLCEGDTTIINFSANGGLGPFDVEINNGVGILLGLNNNSDILVTPADTSTYTILSLSDANGCETSNFSSTAQFNVTQSPNSFFLKSINKGIVSFNNSTAGASSFQWNFGDGNTSTQQSPVHIYDSTGQYLVSLTSTNTAGCSNTYTETITISEISAIKGLLSGEDLTVFPNPAMQELNVTIKLSSKQEIIVTMRDLNGKILISKQSSKKKDHSVLFDIDNLSSGIYLLNVSTSDGRTINTKVFKK